MDQKTDQKTDKTLKRRSTFVLFFRTLIGLAIPTVLLSSCAHQTQKENKELSLRPAVLAWHAKSLIYDKLKERRNTVSMEIISQRPRSIRMDISAMLGIYVGSFAWNELGMQMLLAREKKFITGPANSDSMQELLKLQIDPVALLDIFWDENLPQAEWVCEQQNHLPKVCKHKNLAIQVTWQDRQNHHRLIEIDSPKVNAQLSLTQIEEEVNWTPATFHLKAPENFTVVQLPSKL